MAFLFAVLRIAGMLFVAHAVMLLGADEISSLEMGGIRYIRSLDSILTLYGADPEPLVVTLPEWMQGAALTLIGLPGWAVFTGLGAVLFFAFRGRE